jgi:hypothetical protein
MKIIIRQYDIENTSEIPSINKPSLQPRIQEFYFENAEIIIHSKGKSQNGMVFDSEGVLVLDEIVAYSKDGSRLTRGYSVSGTFMSPESDVHGLILKDKMVGKK